MSTREAGTYSAKASEFLDAARDQLATGRWCASGLAAVHACVSAADAVTARLGGVVSESDAHVAVTGLLRQVAPVEFSGAQERQLLGLIRAKSEIEYEGTMLSERRARILVDQATRFVGWSRGLLE